jgi:amino acid adenylation domain-containing protein
MTIAELITGFYHKGIILRYEDGRLLCSAPKGALSAEESALLRERKQEFIAFLKDAAPAAETNQQPIVPAPRNRHVPLSLNQRSLWYLDQLVPGLVGYNLPSVFKLHGALNMDAFERSLSEIVRRHEILRTTFHVENDLPVQVVTPFRPLSIPLTDLSGEGPTDDETFFALLKKETKTPFDLVFGPLYRVRLIRLTPEEHVFFWMCHHIVWDGWGFDILLDELTALYESFDNGLPSPLKDPSLQYGDYAVWQKQWLKSEEFLSELRYWRNQLQGELPVLQMHADHPRPAQMSYQGGRIRVDMSKQTTDTLRTLSAREDATLFMMLLTIFDVMLHRFTGQEDIIIGCPVWGRYQPETEKMLGFFINTIVLRINSGGAPTFREHLRRVRQVCLDAFSHQKMPIDRLVEEINPKRDLSRTPLYQALFTLQDARNRSAKMGNVAIEQIPAPQTDSAPADVLLWFKETKKELMGRLDYNTDIFDHPTMERFMRHFQVLVRSVTANPDVDINKLQLFDDDDKKWVLSTLNATEKEYARHCGVHDLFERQAAATPHRDALECNGDRLTYAQLDARANQVASYLKTRDVVPGQLIGICLERSLEMVVGVLGILKTGAAYVPLDPNFPPERLSYMMSDANIKVLLTEEAIISQLPSHGVRLVSIDGEASNIALCSDRKPSINGFDPECPAYVIYTSGSTGKPKGVQVPHRAVVNFLTSMQREPGLTKDDILVAITTLSFDISVLEIFLPLSVGAKSVVVSRDVAWDGEQLMQTLSHCCATVMQATPATWRLLLAAGWQGSPSLKILCGGENLAPDLAAELLPKVSELWNMYGPTETTVWSTCYKIVDAKMPLLIGHPIANTQVYILDTNLNPVPIGVHGELYIGGDGVSLGYLNRPELTQKSFLPDPFSNRRGGIIYKTGDRAKFHSNGAIECLGRIDNQIKIRGFRIELGEIEAVLSTLDVVEQCAVIAIEIKPGDVRLVAYLALKLQRTVTSTELRKYLRNSLPDYMVPQHFVELETLPLTYNGKIDRKQLPLPTDFPVTIEDTYIAPRTDNEKYLAELWADLLGRDRIGIHSNFFEIGGHSLLSMTCIARIQKETGVQLSPRVLLLNTLEQIAEQHLADSPEADTYDREQGTQGVALETRTGFWTKVKRKLHA